ncbi:MAG: acyltransferase domain-containing protein, partial [Mycobacterium sp.]
MGEVSAAVVAGALTPQDGLRVIATRSRLMSQLSGQGATDDASHSPVGDGELPELRTALADLAPQLPRIPVITTARTAPEFDADHWAASLHDSVRFSEAVAVAGADYGTFVEVGPHPVLTDVISDTLGEIHHHSIATLQRDAHDTLSFHTNLNRTHTTRPPETDHPPEPHAVLPTTLWHHTRHWMNSPEKPGRGIDASWRSAPHLITIKERLKSAVAAPQSGTLLGRHVKIDTTPPVHLWQAWLQPEVKPYPGFQRIQGVEVVPASVFLQTLLTAASECESSGLSDVRFEHPFVIDQPQMIQVVADGESVTVSSGSAADTPADQWIGHASARISQEEPDQTANSAEQEILSDYVSSVVEPQRMRGIEGQPFAWSVESCRAARDAFHADLELPGASAVALLDAAVHVGRFVDGAGPRLLLPVAAQSIRLHGGLADSGGAVKVRRRGGNDDELVVDIVVIAPDGSRCLDIRSLRYAA